MDAALTDPGSISTATSVRDRLLALLTANLAVAFALAGWYCSEQYVIKINSARVLELDMFRLEAKILTTRRGADPAAEAERQDKRETLGRQIAITLVIAKTWNWIMYLAAAVLETAAIMIVIGRRKRAAHLVAAITILGATCLTLVAINLLVRPDFGGMPSLPARSYVYAALMQGGFGAVLLYAFLKWPQTPTRQQAAPYL